MGNSNKLNEIIGWIKDTRVITKQDIKNHCHNIYSQDIVE